MRLKSRSLSLIAEDYTTDAVELFDNVYNPANFIEGVRDSDIELIEKNGEVEIDQLNSIKHPLAAKMAHLVFPSVSCHTKKL